MTTISRVFIPLLCLWPLSGTLAQDDDILDYDVAYVISAQASTSKTVHVEWDIADKYLLYRDKIHFTTDTPGIRLGQPQMPPSQTKDGIRPDGTLGPVAVYTHRLALDVPVIRDDSKVSTFTLVAHSQGCNDRICYPPSQQRVSIRLAKAPTKPLGALTALDALSRDLGLGKPEDEILDPDEAFQFSNQIVDGNTVSAEWIIAEGYYLYQDKIKFQLQDTQAVSLGAIELPVGEIKNDEFFGKVEVLHNQAKARVHLLRFTSDPATATLNATYQGCSEILGICYPPITKKVRLDLPAGETTSKTPGNLLIVALKTLGLGLLLAFTACMYPMIPIIASLIVGQGGEITVARGLGLSLVYVESMALTFGLIGALTALAVGGIGLQAYFQSPWLLIPFALLFVALAFAMFGFYDIQIPASLQSKLSALSNKQQGGSLISAAIMGVLSALIIGPCAGPVLIGALSYAASSASAAEGFIVLFALGNGIGLPLLIIGAGGAKLLPKAGHWMSAVKAIAGVVLLSIAIIILERMPSLISPTLTMLMWATLFIITAVYMGALESLSTGCTGWRKFRKGLGVILLLYGIVILLGGLTGAQDVTHPLHGSRLLAANTGQASIATSQGEFPFVLKFQPIKTVADLKRTLDTTDKPVMLDFYADWCVYCVNYERYVFPDPAVQQVLSKMILLRADVTATDADDKALMKEMGVFLPPALLFFGPDGKELHNHRIVGEMSTDEFRDHVESVLKQVSDKTFKGSIPGTKKT